MIRSLAAFTAAAALLYAPAALGATGTQSITADVANTLEATFPSAYSWGNLSPGSSGNTSSEHSLTVKSNASWGLKVSTDLADGKMKEWTGSAYVLLTPKVLTNALQYKLTTLAGSAQSGSYSALSSTAALLAGSQDATSDSGVSAGVTFKQVVSFADSSAGSNDYRIAVSYDASQGY